MACLNRFSFKFHWDNLKWIDLRNLIPDLHLQLNSDWYWVHKSCSISWKRDRAGGSNRSSTFKCYEDEQPRLAIRYQGIKPIGHLRLLSIRLHSIGLCQSELPIGLLQPTQTRPSSTPAVGLSRLFSWCSRRPRPF